MTTKPWSMSDYLMNFPNTIVFYDVVGTI